MPILDTQILTYEVRISDEDLKRRLQRQLMQDLDLLDASGNAKPGVTASTTRYGDRNRGGHSVRITRDLSKSGDLRLPKPDIPSTKDTDNG